MSCGIQERGLNFYLADDSTPSSAASVAADVDIP